MKQDQIDKLIRRAADPDSSWNTMEIDIRKYSNTFQSADEKANRLCMTSGDSSDSTEVETEGRKRKLPLRYREESEEPESQSVIPPSKKRYTIPQFPEAFQKKDHRINTPIVPKFPEEGSFQKNDSRRNTPTSNQDPSVPSTSACNCSQNVVPILFQRVIAQMESLKNRVDRVDTNVKVLLETRSQHAPTDMNLVMLPEGISFPLQSEQELWSFNERLKQDANIMATMVKYLNDIAHGKTPRSFLLSILKKVLSPELAVKYSMYGRKGKKAFSELRETVNVILAAVSKRYPATSKETLLDNLSRSLANCTDWVGRRPRPSDVTQVEDTLSLTPLEE